MTKKQLEKINKRNREICELDGKIKTLEYERDALQDKVFKSYKKCDHTYPDGRSAIKPVWYMDYCDICSEMF